MPEASIPGSPRVRALARGALIVLLNIGGNWAAHALTPSPLSRSLLWPGPGIALGLLLRWGIGYWPAVLTGGMIFSYSLSGSVAFALTATASLMALVLPGAVWLRRRGLSGPLTGTRQVLDLLFVSCVVMPLFGASVLSVGVMLHGVETPLPFSLVIPIAWLTITTGVLFTAPLALEWRKPGGRPSVPRALEGLLLAAGALAAPLLNQGGISGSPSGGGLGYLAFPFVLWAAVRFGIGGASLTASAIALVSLWGTAYGRGAFALANPAETMIKAHGYAITLIATGLVVASAIREVRHAARALAVSERGYRLLNEQASDAIIVTGPGGRLLDANPRATELLGYTREEFRNLTIWDLIPPEDRASNPPREVTEIGRPELFERRMLARDGTIRTVEVSVMKVEDLRVQAIVRDVTQRKRAEAELREALSMLEGTLESTTDGILVVDTAGRIRSFNRKFVELWSIPADVLALRDDERALAFVLDQLKDPEAFLAQVRYLYRHPEETSFDVLEFKDGRVFERYSQAHKIGGRVQGRVWSFRDVTRRTELETQLRHAQKMEAVGQLAGGVAHDFNNLLTAIIGHTSLLLARADVREPLREDLSEILRASERAALLTRQLLTFSRQQLIEPRVLDLNLFLRSMRQMLAGALGEKVRLEIRAGDRPLWMHGDVGQLEQVVLNLAINARDAMPAGGTLRLETAAVQCAEGELRPGMRAGDYVRLTVEDTGVGMDEATRSRAFDPFFTTKERGRGTGLGLSTVYGIVQQGGGTVTLESEPGEGARFDLYFPAVSPPDPAGPPARRAPAQRPCRVLLVEDEDTVRQLLDETLSSAGYSVHAVRNGREACDLFERDPGAFDLLLTDVVMSGMSGPELAERLLGVKPALRVLLMSGYAPDHLAGRFPAGNAVGYLQKPFAPPLLIQRISDLLEATAGA